MHPLQEQGNDTLQIMKIATLSPGNPDWMNFDRQLPATAEAHSPWLMRDVQMARYTIMPITKATGMDCLLVLTSFFKYRWKLHSDGEI